MSILSDIFTSSTAFLNGIRLWLLAFEVLFIVLLAVILWYSIRSVLLWRIKKSLYKNAPRVDTVICDKGHVYPADMGLKLTDIPGCESDVLVCPICFDANMANLSKVPE